MNIEDKAYFAVSPVETEKKIRDLTAAWRKLMNVADNLHGMANPSPEIMKRQDQVDADMERIGNQIAELKKSIGVQENVSVRLAKPVEDKAYFDKRIEVETWKSPKGTTYIAGLDQGSGGLFQPFITATYSDGGQQLMTRNPPKFKTEGGARKWLSAEITRRKTPNARQGSKARFAATRIWPNDYSEILNANAKYARLIFDRQKIIRANAGRRIKGEQPLEVPALPTAPEFPFAFADGDYVGLVLGGQANVPKGATVKWAHNANSIKMSRQGSKAKFEHNLTRKISLQESNSPTQVYKITEELYNKAALLKNKSLGYFELRTLIEKALATGEAVKMSRQGSKARFANFKVGQIVKYKNPNSDEDPNQKYIIKEVNGDRGFMETHGGYFKDSKFPPRMLYQQNEIMLASRTGTKFKFAALGTGSLKAGLKITPKGNLQGASMGDSFVLDKPYTQGTTAVGWYIKNTKTNETMDWPQLNSDLVRYWQTFSKAGTKTKFANRGAFAEASSSPVLGSLLEKKVMPEGGWRAVETDGGALVIAFEDGDMAGNFARRAAENGYSATAPMAMAGRYWNVRVQNENKN